ncbi:MAG: Fpg/Nei family DNA glycosylase [Burkholderiales bacterium]|nr:Fpg/Nei family DNA glycosylase [Burkholderiales bacterium]
MIRLERLPLLHPMPELPDVVVYVESLEQRVKGHVLRSVRLLNPFILRTAVPPVSAIEGKVVLGLRRLGKRIVFEFGDELFLVIHLMIAGRLRWFASGEKVKPPGRISLALLEFDNGTLVLTEAGTRRMASIHLVQGQHGLDALHVAGLEVLEADLAVFAERLRSSNHTLKRALTNPQLFSGIGNAYSDEILHRARLSPIAMTQKLNDADVERLYHATRDCLREWTQRLRTQAGDRFPEKVTAFREEMAVHGKFGQPCPVCAAPVQRIVSGDHETNYCPRCQTGGKVLADRALSKLLKKSWPRSIDDLD